MGMMVSTLLFGTIHLADLVEFLLCSQRTIFSKKLSDISLKSQLENRVSDECYITFSGTTWFSSRC